MAMSVSIGTEMMVLCHTQGIHAMRLRASMYWSSGGRERPQVCTDVHSWILVLIMVLVVLLHVAHLGLMEKLGGIAEAVRSGCCVLVTAVHVWIG